jgi:archaellum component FlaF (FlaF/FlaG flagellin family)
MYKFSCRKVIIFLFAGFFIGCHKDNSSSGNSLNSLLQNKWALLSRTATFPTRPSLNFVETDSPNDYFKFGTNDTAYSYVTSYLPFSIDTAFYTSTSNSITFYINQKQNGLIFQNQDGNGVLHDTTVAQIITLTSNSLVLSFPTMGTVTNLVGPGITSYFPGTEIDSLKR